MVYSMGKHFLKHVSIGELKQIGVRVKNIINLEVYFSMHANVPPGVRWSDLEP